MSKPRTFRLCRGSWSPSASPWPCSPRRCSPGAPAPRPSRSRWGRRTSPARRRISQAYGQALEAKGYDISFKDNLGATEIVYAALENGDLDAYADYQGTLLTYLGGDGHRRFGGELQGARGQAQGHRHRGEQAGARGRRERLLRHQGHREEVQAQDGVRPREGRPTSSRSADHARVRGAAALPR